MHMGKAALTSLVQRDGMAPCEHLRTWEAWEKESSGSCLRREGDELEGLL